MEKRKMKIVLTVILCIVAVLLIWNLTDCAEFKNTDMSFADSWRVRTLLVMKETDFIEYGCGFSEDYSIKLGGLTYCLGQDDCNTVYIPELNFYYELFRENSIALQQLLEEYT